MEELKKNANVVDAVNNSTEESYRLLVEAVTNGKHNLTILELPSEVNKGSPKEFEVGEFTEFYLSDVWATKAKNDGVPYPNEFFIVTQIYKDAQGQPEAIRFMGSCGGGYDRVGWNTPNLIKRVSKKF